MRWVYLVAEVGRCPVDALQVAQLHEVAAGDGNDGQRPVCRVVLHQVRRQPHELLVERLQGSSRAGGRKAACCRDGSVLVQLGRATSALRGLTFTPSASSMNCCSPASMSARLLRSNLGPVLRPFRCCTRGSRSLRVSSDCMGRPQTRVKRAHELLRARTGGSRDTPQRLTVTNSICTFPFLLPTATTGGRGSIFEGCPLRAGWTPGATGDDPIIRCPHREPRLLRHLQGGTGCPGGQEPAPETPLHGGLTPLVNNS